MGEREVNEAGQAKRFGIDRTLWRMLMLVLFVILAAIGCFLSVAKGAADISLSQIFTILLHPQAAPQDQIIWNIRLPRMIVGALVGMNLALSGCILQAVMRNPLADPHIIGISSGAGSKFW